ncbi:O-antigen ligase family protein [Herbaspirillum sp. alder98]|uniref:O-antigen ligase family protein n=1 Tax=Herbaspirillum sp. alder98 TaxID=2913096 RepID=UPI001CD87BF5|nr:O-antigen ligase family protein [Herbaspirillum sp. alder98]MCA1324814.1 O-antigen ligase family protein [Herbaspirillum sp. alder98]
MGLRVNVFPGQLVAFLLLLFPVVTLSIHNAGNSILLLLILIALASMAMRVRPDGIGFSDLFRQYWPVALAMSMGVIAVLANQAWSGDFAFKYYDRAFRLAVFPLVLWSIMFVPRKYFRLLLWSLFLAAVVLAVKAFVFFEGGNVRVGNIGFLSIIAYSDIALLFGVLCLTMAASLSTGKVTIACGIIAAAAGAYTGVLTQTRGGWLAVVLFVIFFFHVSSLSLRRKWLVLFSFVVLVAAMFAVNEPGRTRLFNTTSEVINYTQGEGKTTAVGIRLQLWDAALKLFARQPVFGIGRENYEPSIKEMAAQGEVTNELTTLAHSHNEILFNMVISGIFGLVAVLSVYLVPGWYFFRELHHASSEVRAAARCGCLLVLGFFAFGLTDLMFFWPAVAGLYTIMIAAFLAQVHKARYAAAASVG